MEYRSHPDPLPEGEGTGTRPEGSQNGASKPSSISSTFLEQLRARRPEAWQRLVDLYGPVTYRWCRRSNLTAEDAADVVQDVLAAVMLHLPDFRRDRPEDSFGGWLAAITRNKVREHYRRRHGKPAARGGSTAQRRMAEISQPPEPSEESIQSDAQSAACLSRRVLEMIRSEFEPRTWEAFWRVSVGGQSPSHVASDLGVSVAAVYTAKCRVLRRFRQVLGELPE
jgi:RNA polymerase sigma-70 factor (ECF subfamily)